ncbi:hypothetical protein AHF37_07520 [Paragonimus kellicotti]|nr:hypothetical protein AHF37_07520 [Paragonimus kellicotti]
MAFDGSYPSDHSQSIDHGQAVRHNHKRRIMLGRRCRTKLSRSYQQEETAPQPPNFSFGVPEVPLDGSFQFAGMSNPRMSETVDMPRYPHPTTHLHRPLCRRNRISGRKNIDGPSSCLLVRNHPGRCRYLPWPIYPRFLR